MIKLGSKVRDRITGFEGIVLGRTVWITGCQTVGVKGQTLKDGLPTDVQWHDEATLDVIAEPTWGPEAEPVAEKPPKPIGGPATPQQRPSLVGR